MVQFTASAATCDKLRRAQELLRHCVPNGDIAAVIDRALDLLVHDLEKQKFAATAQPRSGREHRRAERDPQGELRDPDAERRDPDAERREPNPTRHIPAAVKREVWQRDAGRCAFRSRNGVRCTERGQLEFDHIRPFGDGGGGGADNVRLLCRAHNQCEAQRFFGVWPDDGERESGRVS